MGLPEKKGLVGLTDIAFADAPAEAFSGVRLALKDPRSGERRVETDAAFLPYFYLKAAKAPEGLPGVLKTETVELSLGGGAKKGKLLKIFVDRPGRVPELREQLRGAGGKVFEADILFLRRYLVDNGAAPFEGVSPKILAFDIEVLSSDGAVLPDVRKDEIIMVSYAVVECGEITEKRVLSCKGKTMPEFVERFGSEKEMLEGFVRDVKRIDPDIIAGYNSDNFDFPYVSERAKRLGVPMSVGIDGSDLSSRRKGRLGGSVPEIFGRQVLDMYIFVRYILSHDPSFRAQTLDLDSVAAELLGERKAEVDFGELPALIKNDKLQKFSEYSLQDSVITAKLSARFVPIILEISKLTSLMPSDVGRMTSGQIVEAFLVRESFREGLVVPNRPAAEVSGERDLRRFEGAFVKEPEKGLHENLAVCDFRSLYPSIIISYNIDPATAGKCDDGCRDNTSPTGDSFCRKRFGIVPFALRKIVKERAGLKKEFKKLKQGTAEYVSANARQFALKLIANSFYGYLGYQNSRWYSFEGARSTAAWGRKYIGQTIEQAELAGFKVVYGDTDSLFLSSPDKKGYRERVEAFVAGINASLPDEMELELENLYSRGVFLTKKRYAVITPEGRIVIKGLERVRRDWAGIARRTQEEVLLAVLRDADPAKAMRIISEAVRALRERRVAKEDVIIYTQLTKRPSQYKLTSPHVEAAKLASRPARAGTIIRFIIVKGKGSISSRARPADSVTLADYDPDYYVENQLLPAVMRIMEAVGYGEDEFRKQKSLDGFFG